MLALTSGQQSVLASGRVMLRFFIYDTTHAVGFWNDVGDIAHAGRTYHGSGSLIQISSLGAKGDLTIPGLQITLSGVDTQSVNLIRGEDIAQTPIEVLIGIFDVENHTLIDNLFVFFTGVIDDCQITTPEAGGTGTITLTCESSSRALTVQRTATRSQASQVERDADDTFYDDTGVQRDKPLYFGRKAPVEAVSGGGTRTF